MNSINNSWNSTKRAETPYFHCGSSSQKGNERKGKQEKKTQQQHENG